MDKARKATFTGVMILLAVWLALNASLITGEPNGAIRLAVGILFALLILFRRSPSIPAAADDSVRALTLSFAVPACAISGTIFVITGLVLDVAQFEWFGVLALALSGLVWSLPRRRLRDIVLSVFVFYWVHPLPGQIFLPMQAAMQTWSVAGSEWLLHMFNVRVWADGLCLRTGAAVYEVPAACSGMRTVTTLLLFAMGMSILKRFNVRASLATIAAALLQGVALNVIRISAIIGLAPWLGGSAGTHILHDTAGIAAIAGIFLVYLEVGLYEDAKSGATDADGLPSVERVRLMSNFPVFWRIVLVNRMPVVLTGIVLVLGSGLAYKSRAYHRAEMIKPVAEELRDSGLLGQAQRAMDRVLRLVPDDLEWAMTRTRLLVMRGDYEHVDGALSDMPAFPVTDEPGALEMHALERSILRAYSLMGMGEVKEAAELVGSMPEWARERDPRVTMILAEMGFYADDPEQVAEKISVSAEWPPNRSRIRGLYPYLRLHRKWNAIADSDTLEPYTDPMPAFCAVEAYMNLNMTPNVARITYAAMESWPDDLRLLEPLFFLAMKRQDETWETRFAEHLKASIDEIEDPDALYGLIDKCFRLVRPDLAWALYRRIKTLDQTHPGLYLIAARYGAAWFVFRRQFVGLSSARPGETINLYFENRYDLLDPSVVAWDELYDRVPLARELSVKDTVSVRKEFLRKALAEFRKRDARPGLVNPGTSSPIGRSPLSVSMQYEYAAALEMNAEITRSRLVLASVMENVEGQGQRSKTAQAEVLGRRGEWHGVYEVLRESMRGTSAHESRQSLGALIMFCRAQINLRLGLGAMSSARMVRSVYPNSSQAIGMLAESLIEFDSPEEALAVLQQPRIRERGNLVVMEARSLYETERYHEAEAFTRTRQLPVLEVPDDAPQAFLLPPAEQSILWHVVAIPSASDLAATASTMRQNLRSAASPFLAQLMRKWLRFYGSTGTTYDAGTLIDDWSSCGRDPIEKATALNHLTILLCSRELYAAALEASRVAVELLPESPVLNRALIGLAREDPAVIRAARKRCPGDSEIWLAEIVAHTRAAGLHDDGWALSSVEHAIDEGFVTPAAMTRAADYLGRIGMEKAGRRAAENAVSRARGLLPAYVAGVECALRMRDKDWLLVCTRDALRTSLRPLPDYQRRLVQLKSSASTIDTDADMVEALTSLRRVYPDDALFAQMLGYVRYQRGGRETVHAIYDMDAAIEMGATNRLPYIVAAEAARVSANPDKAVELLKQGLREHPSSIIMLNNLAYTMAIAQGQKDEAATMAARLEKILRLPDSDTRLSAEKLSREGIRDTIAFAYLSAGEYAKAESMLDRIERQTTKGSRYWFRARLHRATIALQRWQEGVGSAEAKTRAVDELEQLLGQTEGLPDEDILGAMKIVSEARGDTDTTKKVFEGVLD